MWVRFTCQWKWVRIYFDCIYLLFLLVFTLLLEPATVSPWTVGVLELDSSLSVPVFNTILQHLPNKHTSVPLSTWKFSNCPLEWIRTCSEGETIFYLPRPTHWMCTHYWQLRYSYILQRIIHWSLVRIPLGKYMSLHILWWQLLIWYYHLPFSNSYNLSYRLDQRRSKWEWQTLSEFMKLVQGVAENGPLTKPVNQF
jgi:hypothetical protein